MHTIDSKVLAEIRSEVCDTVLKWTTIIGAVAVVLSFLRMIEFGFLPVMIVHAAIIMALTTAYVLRKQIPYRIRAASIIGVMIIVAVGGHLTFGTPTRIEFFIAASIMGAVFFGEKTGVFIAGVSVAILGAVYFGFYAGLLPLPVIIPPLSPTNWVANAASMVVAALAPLLAVNRYRVHLNREHRRVVAADQAKSTFLATMSHELRTPMTAILGLTDLLLTEQSEGPTREKISRISKAGRLLLDLLNDVLDFSKLEADAVVIQATDFTPRDLIEDICNLFEPLAAEKGVRLQALVASDVSASLVADAGRLRQAVLNLVGNAVKFTDSGAISILVSEGNDGRAHWLKIEVADTGIGISEPQQAKLFQPFVQAEQGASRRFGGTGLGLAISRKFAELMGGTLTLRSAPGVGSTFTLTIPVVAADVEHAPAIQSASQPDASSLHVLVADDDETIRLLFQIMLQKWGHTVDTVGNGHLAVHAVETRAYDAILMDMNMPEMDGVAAARAIRTGETERRQVPIIGMTADVGAEARRSYLAAGATALITKPANWTELSRLLRHVANTGATAS